MVGGSSGRLVTRVAQLTDFQQMLAAPVRGPITQQVLAGQTVFNNLRCGERWIHAAVGDGSREPRGVPAVAVGVEIRGIRASLAG